MATGNWQIRTSYRYPDPTPNSAGSVVDSIDITDSGSFADGTGDGEIGPPYSFLGDLVAAPMVIDLNAVPGPFGNANLSAVKKFYFRNRSETDPIDIGGGADAVAFLPDTITVPPGGRIFMVFPDDGISVVGGTSDTLTIDPGANTVPITLELSGIV